MTDSEDRVSEAVREPSAAGSGSGAWENTSVAEEVSAGADVDDNSAWAGDTGAAPAGQQHTPPPPNVPFEVNQSLARLEMNSLEVKLFLDSIDQRISRMEPRLEGMMPAEQVQSAAPDARAAAPGQEPFPSTTERRRRAQGVPVERRRALRTEPQQMEDGRPWARTTRLRETWKSIATTWRPWFAAHRGWAPIAALSLIAVVALLLWGSRQNPPAGPQPAVFEAGPVLSGAGPNGAPKASAGIPWTTGVSPSFDRDPYRNGTARSSKTTVEQGVAVPQNSGFAPPFTVAPSAPGLAPATDPSAHTDASSLPGVAETASPENTEAQPARPDSVPSGRIIAPSSKRVNVSSGVMAGNLVYSRPPVYPHGFAGLFHTQGEVVLQAIISKRGHVENLRVISGHYMLRGAAKDAVRTWRYRPYIINGYPVQVATIVSVEFRR